MKVIIDQMAIEFEERGTGPVILMLHGWKDDLRTFEAVARELPGYRIVRVDMPGFGGSDLPLRTDWHIDDYARFIRAFLEKLNLESYAIVGHSFGGRVAIKGLSTGVLEAQKLILIASAGVARRRTSRNALFTGLSRITRLIAYIPQLSYYYNDLRRTMYERMGSDYYAAGEMRHIFLNAIEEDLTEAARSLTTPTLLIWGEGDTQTPLSEGQRLHELIAGSKLVALPGADHFVHRSHAADAAREIRDFL